MGLVKRLTSLRIFPKLVLTFLLVLSPLYFIGLQIIESGSDNVKEEIANSLSSRVNLYIEILDNDFERVMLLMQEYVNDEDLLKLSISAEIMSDFERTKAILGLKSRLDLLKRSSKFVENVVTFIPSIDRMVTSNDNAISGFDQSQFDALTQPTNRFESPFLVWNDRIFISIPYPDLALSKNPLFVIAVEVSQYELSSTISQFTNEGGGAVLKGRRIDWAVAGAVDVLLEEQFLEQMNNVDLAVEGGARNITINDEQYMVAQKGSDHLDMTMMMFVPVQNVYQPLQSYRTWLIILSTVSVLIALAFSFSIYRIIHRPLKTLVRSFRKIEEGNFKLIVHYSLKDEFGYLYEQFNAMVRQLEVLIHEVYEQKYRARLAELRHLQSQINPHFLYNTYFILYRMAMLEDNKNIVLLTKHLGEYFQYVTRDGSEDEPLEREVNHAKSYMEIQSIRFGNRIETSFGELPDRVIHITVPRLILQPIIENAYNHALEKRAKDGRLRVYMNITDEILIITVEDNSGEMTNDKLDELHKILRISGDVTESTALSNVHRRLQIKYGDPAGLRLIMNENSGLTVEIVIPILGDNVND